MGILEVYQVSTLCFLLALKQDNLLFKHISLRDTFSCKTKLLANQNDRCLRLVEMGEIICVIYKGLWSDVINSRNIFGK